MLNQGLVNLSFSISAKTRPTAAGLFMISELAAKWNEVCKRLVLHLEASIAKNTRDVESTHEGVKTTPALVVVFIPAIHKDCLPITGSHADDSQETACLVIL